MYNVMYVREGDSLGTRLLIWSNTYTRCVVRARSGSTVLTGPPCLFNQNSCLLLHM